jgi:hypothetical protein
MILLMQRLHPDDLAGRLLAKQEWTHLNLPALAPYNQSIPLYNGGVKHWLCDEPLEANRSGREEPKEGSARSAMSHRFRGRPHASRSPLPAVGLPDLTDQRGCSRTGFHPDPRDPD